MLNTVLVTNLFSLFFQVLWVLPPGEGRLQALSTSTGQNLGPKTHGIRDARHLLSTGPALPVFGQETFQVIRRKKLPPRKELRRVALRKDDAKPDLDRLKALVPEAFAAKGSSYEQGLCMKASSLSSLPQQQLWRFPFRATSQTVRISMCWQVQRCPLQEAIGRASTSR